MPAYTDYEWDIETVNEDGDVVDHHHAAKLSDYGSLLRTITEPAERLVLVRDTHGSYNERVWAYATRGEDGKWQLPRSFTDEYGARLPRLIPQRFHDALQRAQA